MAIRTKPEPTCPDCGAKMILRYPPEGASWKTFWGCMDYPDCKGARDILSDGTPAMDEEWDSDDDFWDWELE
jgi:ssDNA-binding Zn-finger/Zn-ribbon topoisomerase 1